jgi:hypothetical protein
MLANMLLSYQATSLLLYLFFQIHSIWLFDSFIFLLHVMCQGWFEPVYHSLFVPPFEPDMTLRIPIKTPSQSLHFSQEQSADANDQIHHVIRTILGAQQIVVVCGTETLL